MNRRDLHRLGVAALGGLASLTLGVPGVAYLLDPLRKASRQGGFQKLASLSQLTPEAPQSFAVIDERQDAWIKYPREPVGSVWLVRQPPGVKPEVLAFTAECPHLGCAVGLSADGKTFLCPCHTSHFDLDGTALNRVPPRPMDGLEVELSDDADPEVRVRFRRFRAQEKEKTPLV